MKHFLFAICLLFVVQSFAGFDSKLDTPCDTIKLIDGRVIVARVYFEDRHWVKYANCNPAIKTKDQIEKYQVSEIIYASGNDTQPFVENRTRLNRTGIYWIIGAAALLIGLTIAAIFLLN